MSTIQVESTFSEETTYEPMYVIYSNYSLEYIKDNLLTKHGRAEGIGMMKIETFKGKETNRTLLFLSDEIYQSLGKAGLTEKGMRGVDFKISSYKLRKFDLPKSGDGPNLFIPLSAEFSATANREYLENILKKMAEYGMFDTDDFLVKIPLKTRAADEHKGMAFISFKRSVPLEIIACTRAFLYGYEGLQCFWSREQKERPKVEKPKVSKGKKVYKKSSKPEEEVVRKIFETVIEDIDLEAASDAMKTVADKAVNDILKVLETSSMFKDAKNTFESLLKTDPSVPKGAKEFAKHVFSKVEVEVKKKERKADREMLKNNFVAVEPVTENAWKK